jgi:hypothetical protein
LIVVVVAIALFVVASNVNGIVKTAVEDLGSSSLKTTVSLNDVDIQLLKGRMQLSGLTIANPEGYEQDNIFVMNDIVLDLELASLKDKLIEVKEISVDGLRVVAEQKNTTTNLQALLNNIDSGAKEPVAETPSDPSDPIDVLIKIKALSFTNGSTYLVSDRWGDSDLTLPTIALNNIGGSGGVPPEQLAQDIMQPLLKQLISAVQDAIKEQFEGKAKEKLREKEDELKEKLNSKLGEKLGTDTDSLKSLLSR